MVVHGLVRYLLFLMFNVIAGECARKHSQVVDTLLIWLCTLYRDRSDWMRLLYALSFACCRENAPHRYDVFPDVTEQQKTLVRKSTALM